MVSQFTNLTLWMGIKISSFQVSHNRQIFRFMIVGEHLKGFRRTYKVWFLFLCIYFKGNIYFRSNNLLVCSREMVAPWKFPTNSDFKRWSECHLIYTYRSLTNTVPVLLVSYRVCLFVFLCFHVNNKRLNSLSINTTGPCWSTSLYLTNRLTQTLFQIKLNTTNLHPFPTGDEVWTGDD